MSGNRLVIRRVFSRFWPGIAKKPLLPRLIVGGFDFTHTLLRIFVTTYLPFPFTIIQR